MKKTNVIATTGFWLMLGAIVFGIATNGERTGGRKGWTR